MKVEEEENWHRCHPVVVVVVVVTVHSCLQTWLVWTIGELPADKETLIKCHICPPHGYRAVGEEEADTGRER